MKLELPYRLETLDDIREAMRINVFGLEDRHFRSALRLARGVRLEKPKALLQAKPVTTRDIISITVSRERKKIVDRVLAEENLLSLPLSGQVRLVEGSIPWVKELVLHQNLLSSLSNTIPNGGRLFALPSGDVTPLKIYETALTIRRVLRRELLHIVRTGNSKALSREDLKKAIAACVLYDPANEDLLEAFQIALAEQRQNLFENALMEKLFVRIPRLVDALTSIPPGLVRRKFVAKVESLGLRAAHRTQLCGYFPREVRREQLREILSRIDAVRGRMTLSEDHKKRLQDYIRALHRTIHRGSVIYRELFLNRDLEKAMAIHKSVPLVRYVVSYDERIIRSCSRPITLSFYPTKDLLDIFKGIVSRDCLDPSMSKLQLLYPGHFNIRIIRVGDGQPERWIGNIYMLDLTRDHYSKCMLVDRVQLPRDLKDGYHDFFTHLRHIFAELFENVEYDLLLAPASISNNAGLQNLWNQYSKKLLKKEVSFQSAGKAFFESLNGQTTYRVLLRKDRQPLKPRSGINA